MSKRFQNSNTIFNNDGSIRSTYATDHAGEKEKRDRKPGPGSYHDSDNLLGIHTNLLIEYSTLNKRWELTDAKTSAVIASDTDRAFVVAYYQYEVELRKFRKELL